MKLRPDLVPKTRTNRKSPSTSVEQRTRLKLGRLQARGQIRDRPIALVMGLIESGLIFVTDSQSSRAVVRSEDQRRDDKPVKPRWSADELWFEIYANRFMTNKRRQPRWAARGHFCRSPQCKRGETERESRRPTDAARISDGDIRNFRHRKVGWDEKLLLLLNLLLFLLPMLSLIQQRPDRPLGEH